MAKKHGRVVTYREGPPPINSQNLLIMRSHDKLETLYLHHHNAYGHKTYQSGDPSKRGGLVKSHDTLNCISTCSICFSLCI